MAIGSPTCDAQAHPVEMPGKVNRPYHHGNLRDTLVDAALAAVDRDGKVPSLRAVAALAGVSHNAPYRHFGNQADLLGHVAARCFTGLARAVGEATVGTDNPVERARAGLAAYIRYGLEHPTRYQLMFGGTSPLAAHATARDAGGEAFELLVAGARRFEVEDPYAAAFRAFVMLHGAVDLLRYGYYPPGVPEDRDNTIAQIVDSALGVLRGY